MGKDTHDFSRGRNRPFTSFLWKNKNIFVWQQDHSDYESTETNSGALATKNTATPVGFAPALRDVLS